MQRKKGAQWRGFYGIPREDTGKKRLNAGGMHQRTKTGSEDGHSGGRSWVVRGITFSGAAGVEVGWTSLLIARYHVLS